MKSDETQREIGTVAGEQHVEQICEAFRQALSDGHQPRIEDYLRQGPKPARNILLRELIAAELELRKSLGENVKLWEYYQRFPKQAESVEGAMLLLDRRRGSKTKPAETHETAFDASAAPESADPVSNLISEGSSWDAETRRIAQFQLLEHLGEGRFGSVWKARDSKLDRVVAIKIPRQGALSQRQVDLFFREARSAAQMRHPNIVSIFEVGREADTVYMATEFVQGVDLQQYLESKGPRSPRKAAEFCAKVADALHCAHEAGVVHRDLKPSNIMVDMKGQPHVADFGLAKRKEVDLTFTIEGQVLGTPAYMSPEQAGGQARSADHRTDVYALGVILFEMITGELPFRGDRKMLIMQKLRDPPPSPRQLNSRVTRDLETICLKCLERDPQKRYSTSRELGDDLRRFVAGEPIQARPLGTFARIWRVYERNPQAAMMTAGIYMTLLGTMLMLWVGLGLVLLGLGIPVIKQQAAAMVELAGTVTVFSLPMLYCGWRTIYGRLHALGLGIVLLAGCLLVGVALLTGWDRHFVSGELVDLFHASAFARYQILSLLSFLFAFGLVTHLMAVPSQFGRNDRR